MPGLAALLAINPIPIPSDFCFDPAQAAQLCPTPEPAATPGMVASLAALPRTAGIPKFLRGIVNNTAGKPGLRVEPGGFRPAQGQSGGKITGIKARVPRFIPTVRVQTVTVNYEPPTGTDPRLLLVAKNADGEAFDLFSIQLSNGGSDEVVLNFDDSFGECVRLEFATAEGDDGDVSDYVPLEQVPEAAATPSPTAPQSPPTSTPTPTGSTPTSSPTSTPGVSGALLQDFESGLRLWYAENGVWESGAPLAGPNGCHQGTQCAGTVLNGNYPFTHSRLISPPIQLGHGTVLDPLYLRIWHWFSWGGATGGAPGRGVIQASVFDTAQSQWSPWQNVSDVFQGSSGAWAQYVADLNALSGNLVRLAFFHQGANAFSTGSGWYIEIEVNRVEGCGDDSAPSVLPVQDFESGGGLWFGDNGVWEFGTPTSGPGECFQGTQCAATVLNGKYPFAHSRLVSPAIQLPNNGPTLLEPLLLTFWHWFAWGGATGGAPGRGVVQVDVFDDATQQFLGWQSLGQSFESSSSVWTQHTVDISALAGKIVKLGFFHLGANAFSSGPGWYIDQIELRKVNGCVATSN